MFKSLTAALLDHATMGPSEMIATGTEIELTSPPKDGISALAFARNSNYLLASSWDTHLYLYDPLENRLKGKAPFDAALLDCCFGKDDTISYTGGLNRQVMQIDWNTLKVSILGTHEDAVKCLVRCEDTGMLFSGSWDNSVTAWDVNGMKRVQKLSLPGKVYTMDCVKNMLVVGMSERHVHIYDTRNLSAPLQTRESALRHQTRCIKLFPTSDAFAISSIEGRVGVEYVDPEMQAKNFAFKCHRAPLPEQENMEMVYPVNALAFHPRYGTFCTGGSDGVVCAWDPLSKKRIKALPKHQASISSLSFNRDGSLLAIASSYCYEEGEKDHAPDSIFVRSMDDNEIRGKQQMQT